MPITTEKRTPKVKRGPALAIAGGLLLVLLSLPLVLTLFPDGVSVGRNGVSGRWGLVPGQRRVWNAALFEIGGKKRRTFVVGWNHHSYALTFW